MKCTNIIALTVAATWLSSAAWAPSSASTISYQQHVDRGFGRLIDTYNSSSPSGPTSLSDSVDISLQKFDPTLGSLTSILLEVSVFFGAHGVTFSGQGGPLTGTPGTPFMTASEHVALKYTLPSSADSNAFDRSASCDAARGTNSYFCSGNLNNPISELDGFDLLFDVASLSDFTGIGQNFTSSLGIGVDVGITCDKGTLTQCFGSTSSLSLGWSGDLKVTYTYTVAEDIPEGAGISLLAGGLLAFCGLVRKKRAIRNG